MVSFQSGAKGVLGALLVDLTLRRSTSHHHLLSPQTRFHPLSCRQSTLLTRLRTGACDFGAYRAHFEPDRLMCCGSEPENPRTALPPLPASHLPARRSSFLPTTQNPTFSCLPPQQFSCDKSNPPLPCRLRTLRLALLPTPLGSRPLSSFPFSL